MPLLSSHRSRIAILAALAGQASLFAADASWSAATAAGNWSDAANWSAGVPASGDNVVFANPPIATTGTINIDVSPVIGTFTKTTGTPIVNLVIGPGQSLTVANGFSNTSSALNITNAAAVVEPATPAGLGIIFTGPTTVNSISSSPVNLLAPITSSFPLTKTGPSQMTLGGHNPAFTGDITVATGAIQLSGTSNQVLGSGKVTFATTGTMVSVAENSGNSRTLENDFVQNNSVALSGTQYAQVGFFAGSFGHRVLTLNGDFSTGTNYLVGQSLAFSAGNTQAHNESTIVLNGDWSAFQGGVPYAPATAPATVTGGAIRVLDGTLQINAQQAIPAAGGYALNVGTTSNSVKVLFNGAFTVAQPISMLSGNAATGALSPNVGFSHTGPAEAALTGPLAMGGPGGTNAKGMLGLNIFSRNAGAQAVFSGRITGALATSVSYSGAVDYARQLRINDGYTYTSANLTNSLQLPEGTVVLTNTTGVVLSNYVGGTRVVRGTLLVNSTLAHSATGGVTGLGPVLVGQQIAGASGISATTTLNNRSLTNFPSAIADTLVIGQPISGTGIPVGAVITGVAVGNAAANSTVVISLPATVTGVSADIAAGAYSTTATLGGTGIGAIVGDTTILAGSTLAPGESAGSSGDLRFAGNLTLTGTTVLDINGLSPGVSHDTVTLVDAAKTITYGGTLQLAIGTKLGVGENTVTPIAATLRSGAFTAVNVTGTAYGSVALTESGGVWSGTVGAGTFAFTPTTGALTVTEVASGSPIETWRTTFFGVSTNTGNAADTFDFDGDGLANLIEYANGTNPTTANASKILVGKTNDGLRLTLTFDRIADASLTYTVQGANDLVAGPWTTVATRTGDANDTVTIEDTVTIASGPRRFLRLRVSY